MAYESTWKYGTIRDLHELELNSGLQEYINKFLSNRTCHVRIESIVSDPNVKKKESHKGDYWQSLCLVLR